MNDVPFSSSLAPDTPPRFPWYHWRRLGFNFLTISLVVHLLLGFGAAYLIVQTIQAKRKQTFAGPAQGPNAPTRALEHKVQMQKKQATMSAPAPLRRITTTSMSKIALPAMPAMPKLDTAVVPLSMAGMGGIGVGLSMGGGGGSGGGSGGGLNLFGFRDKHGGALPGTFFDLKQTPERRPTPIGNKEYQAAISAYVRGGMNDGSLTGHYFKGPNLLYATQIFIPKMSAAEGPKAFNLQSEVKPSRWIVHYKGSVTAPESGTYYFVGVCDDVLVVRFNNSIVLDCGSMFPSGHKPTKFYDFDGVHSMVNGWFKGLGRGSPVQVEAGHSYPIDILIGEWPGGEFKAFLLIEKEGAEYKKDSLGNPILPLFRTGEASVPSGVEPVYQPNGPIWRGASVTALPSLQ